MTTAITRLHITPFTPDLLPSVLPASLQSSATDISFHTLPTFPENNYGYVSLPTMEADKIKKKLHGSILKGKKFKVETARPEKKRDKDENEPADGEPVSSSKKKSSKKRKAENGVLDGHELPAGRKVKRAWTESADGKQERRKEEKKQRKEEKKAKAQIKSKYSEKDECLFRTQVPPNKSSIVDEKQEKKSKKKKKPAKEVVVHEFENTVTHPSFLRSGTEGTAPAATFEEGKGWLDDSGNVKEVANDRIKSSQYRPGQVPGAKEKKKPKSQKSAKEPKPVEKEEFESEDWTSSSGSSSDDGDSESEESAVGSSDKSSSPEQTEGKQNEDEQSHSKTTSLDQDESPAETDQSQQLLTEIHPLESIFKRPASEASENKSAAESNAPFSFFGNDDIESDEEPTGPAEPHTPFGKKDLENREQRSAAPTPDTGLVGRTINWNDSEVDAMDDESSIDTPASGKAGAEGEETEFANWFWENRGDNNRAWKKRRREAAKEERQRENRRKGMKGRS